MDPITNPFAPGAGTAPPELAGRDDIREQVRIVLERTRRGLAAKSVILIGLRGVGKTVLLNRMRLDAEAAGFSTLMAEAPESRSLPALLAPQLRQALLELSWNAHAKHIAERALRALAGFVGAMKLRYNDIEVGIDFEPEPGLADNGDLEHDLQALLLAAADAAAAAGTALVLFVDELQYVASDELAALIVALHGASQRSAPVVLVGAGLPQLRGRMGDAKSYAERLFEFPEIRPLDEAAATLAIVRPIEQQGAAIQPTAVSAVFTRTQGYPYFLQEWGKHAWDAAPASPITRGDVEKASALAVAALDESFFRVRFDRLTPTEKRYLRAMADLGPGPTRSGDIAARMDKSVTAVAPTRSKLIDKGMIWSPNHGDTAFTVPLFDEFMRRIIPGDDW
ncbi:AAA family ATPase [bacterium]|nr:AAA family ATPase [bacterium]